MHPQPAAVLALGDHEESLHRSGLRVSGVELQPVRVDVVRLVVEPERRGVGRAEAKLELGHIDREIQGRVVPSRVRHRGEIVGPAIWLLAAAILVLELEPQGLALVEAVRRAVERRGVPDPQRRPEGGSRPVELEQRLKGRHGCAGPRQPHAGRPARHLPAAGIRRVEGDAARRLHLDHASPHPQAAYDSALDRIEHGDDADAPAARADDVERVPAPRPRPAGPLGSQQLALEQDEGVQRSACGAHVHEDGTAAIRNEPLNPADEAVLPLPSELRRLPHAAPRIRAPLEMPGQLEEMLLAARKFDHVQRVGRPGDHGAGYIPVAAAGPSPLALHVEHLAGGVAGWL